MQHGCKTIKKEGAKKVWRSHELNFLVCSFAAFSWFFRSFSGLKTAQNQKVFHIPPFSSVSLIPSAFRPFSLSLFPLPTPIAHESSRVLIIMMNPAATML
jgi:hypothetical protein